MTPDVEQSLARLSPDPGNLQRDAVLFAAGRASARPGVGWKLAVASLAAGHVVWTAAWLWPTAAPSAVAVPAPLPVVGDPPSPPEPESPDPPAAESHAAAVFGPAEHDPLSYASLKRTWRLPSAAGPAGPPPGPPLAAGSDPRFLRLN